MAKLHIEQPDDHLDLVPLIDCIFLLLLFFMLCGRMSTDQRTEQISVPPTKTAVKFEDKKWQREVINIFGTTQAGDPPRNSLRLGAKTFASQGINDYTGYQQLRAILDQIYDRVEKYDDPKGTGMKLPKVIIEIRADSNTEYRVVQEVQQILTDGLDLTNMQPKKGFDPKAGRPFVNLDFTTRKSDAK